MFNIGGIMSHGIGQPDPSKIQQQSWQQAVPHKIDTPTSTPTTSVGNMKIQMGATPVAKASSPATTVTSEKTRNAFIEFVSNIISRIKAAFSGKKANVSSQMIKDGAAFVAAPKSINEQFKTTAENLRSGFNKGFQKLENSAKLLKESIASYKQMDSSTKAKYKDPFAEDLDRLVDELNKQVGIKNEKLNELNSADRMASTSETHLQIQFAAGEIGKAGEKLNTMRREIHGMYGDLGLVVPEKAKFSIDNM